MTEATKVVDFCGSAYGMSPPGRVTETVGIQNFQVTMHTSSNRCKAKSLPKKGQIEFIVFIEASEYRSQQFDFVWEVVTRIDKGSRRNIVSNIRRAPIHWNGTARKCVKNLKFIHIHRTTKEVSIRSGRVAP